MNLNFLKPLSAIFTSLLLMTSCSSDDSESSNNNSTDSGIIEESSTTCETTPTDQIAQGIFKEDSFTASGGAYREQNFGDKVNYFCTIYVKSPIDLEACIFPEFEGTDDTIIFSLSSLEAQTIELSNDLTQGFDTVTLNFNRIDLEGETKTELGCGTLIIDGINEDNQLTGSVIANGDNGSTIDGNFVLDFCDSSSF